MRSLNEPFCSRFSHSLRGRIGIHPIGMLFFIFDESLHFLIVFEIGNNRRRFIVIMAVVLNELLHKL